MRVWINPVSSTVKNDVPFVAHMTWMSQWSGFKPEDTLRSPAAVDEPKNCTYFSLTAKLERGASALHAIPGKIQNRPVFHRSFPPSIHPSISAHRPLTTPICEECVRSPSSRPAPPLPPLSSLTSISCKRSTRKTFSLVFPITPSIFPCHVSRVVVCDQSGGNNSVRMWRTNHIRLR